MGVLADQRKGRIAQGGGLAFLFDKKGGNHEKQETFGVGFYNRRVAPWLGGYNLHIRWRG